MGAELALQLQTDDIAAVQQAFVTAVISRNPNTLWYLANFAYDIPYENVVKGSSLSNIDTNVTKVNIGAGLFADWFNLHNNYFATVAGISNVNTFKAAVESTYRWRVSQYFNDVMIAASGVSIQPQYVFPHYDLHLATYTATNGTTGTFTKGSGPVDLTKAGPGILSVVPTDAIGVNGLTMSVTAVYSDTTTAAITFDVPNGSTIDLPLAIGGQALTGNYTAPSSNGVVAVADTTLFKQGMLVAIFEDLTGTTDFFWKTEVAEVASIGSGNITLRQPTVPGGTAFPNGLRNSYTTSAIVYPMFIDISGVTNSTGESGDAVVFEFYPDRPQGFKDITSITTAP